MPAWLDVIVADAHAALLQDDEAAPARAYLLSRDVPEAQWLRFRLGFANALRPIIQCSQAFADWRWVYFGNIVLPLTAPTGEVIGVQVRHDEAGTFRQRYSQFYVHHSTTELYPPVFGMAQALPAIWATKQAILVEGSFDLFPMAACAPNTLALMTARPSAAVVRFLRRYTRRVITVLDTDEAGRQSAARFATKGHPFTVITPPYLAKDPGELLRRGRGCDITRIAELAAVHL